MVEMEQDADSGIHLMYGTLSAGRARFARVVENGKQAAQAP